MPGVFCLGFAAWCLLFVALDTSVCVFWVALCTFLFVSFLYLTLVLSGLFCGCLVVYLVVSGFTTYVGFWVLYCCYVDLLALNLVWIALRVSWFLGFLWVYYCWFYFNWWVVYLYEHCCNSIDCFYFLI